MNTCITYSAHLVFMNMNHIMFNHKKTITRFLGVVLLFGCSKDNLIDESKNNLLILKIDYVTGKFEGAIEQALTGEANSDSIPIRVNYRKPGDFGDISLYYLPSNQLVFNGSIIWMGRGEISYPQNFRSANNFKHLDAAISQPDADRFQVIFYNLVNNPIDYAKIWNSIRKLKIVSEYLRGNKRIGVFLYTPSVGVGDPADWDWFIVMQKTNTHASRDLQSRLQ